MPPDHTTAQIDRIELVRLVCHDSFYQFVKRGWQHFFPEPFLDGRHIQVICQEAQDVVTGESDFNAIITNIPPGHSKSRIFSVLLPAWCFGPRGDRDQWLCASLSAKLSIRDSNACREVIKSDWFQQHWPIRFKASEDAKTCWSLETGAKRDTTSTDARATGLRAHKKLLDDPQDLNFSALEIENANNWIMGAWGSRDNFGQTPPKEFLVQQRVGPFDATARLKELQPKKWRHIWLPVEFDPENACPVDWRTEPGELLWPEAYAMASGDPLAWVAQKKIEVGPRNWDTQYNQRPHPDGGTEFQSEWMSHRFNRLMGFRVDMWLISVDASFKDKLSSDYVVFQLWAKIGAQYFCVAQIRDRMNYPTMRTRLREWRQSWIDKGIWPDLVVIEDKANGTALIAELITEVEGVVPFEPRDSKEVRWRAVSGQWEAGQVALPEKGATIVNTAGEVIHLATGWVSGFVEEHLTVPAAEHDDQVDCSTQALLVFRQRFGVVVAGQAVGDISALYDPEGLDFGYRL